MRPDPDGATYVVHDNRATGGVEMLDASGRSVLVPDATGGSRWAVAFDFSRLSPAAWGAVRNAVGGFFDIAGYLRYLGYSDTMTTALAVLGQAPTSSRLTEHEVCLLMCRRAVADRTFPDHEFSIMSHTVRLNLAGVRVDPARAQRFQGAVIQRRNEEIAGFVRAYPDLPVSRITSSAAVEAFIRHRWGVELSSLSRDATALVPVADCVEFLNDRRRLLHLDSATKRGLSYVRGGSERLFPLCYHGTHTGRFSARSDRAALNLHQFWKAKEDLPELALERQVVVAPPGHLMRAGDLSSIEARVVAWLADEHELLGRFRDGEDVYAWFGSLLSRGQRVAKQGPNAHLRALGKTAILGLCFGMGLVTFARRVRRLAPECTANEIELAFETYRRTFSSTARFRGRLTGAVWDAISWGESSVGRLRFRLFEDPYDHASTFAIDLPTGRTLHYRGFLAPRVPNAPMSLEGAWYAPAFSPVPRQHGDPRPRHYSLRGQQFPDGRWRATLHGHVLLENLAQAIARDVMAHQCLDLEELGLPVSFHTHDEIVCLCEDCGCVTHSASCAWSLAGNAISSVMSSLPRSLAVGLDGLPLACELNPNVERTYA